MRSIEQIKSDFAKSGIHDHRPHVGMLIDELLNLAFKYRSDAKHDKNAIRAMRKADANDTL